MANPVFIALVAVLAIAAATAVAVLSLAVAGAVMGTRDRRASEAATDAMIRESVAEANRAQDERAQ